MSAKAKLDALLKDVGATLLRRGRHYVYHISEVGRFVVPSSPSDKRAWDNSYRRLMKLLGRTERRFRKKRRFRERAEEGSKGLERRNTFNTCNVVAGGIRWKGEREP